MSSHYTDPSFLKYLATLKGGDTARESQRAPPAQALDKDVFGFAFLLRRAIGSSKWKSLLDEAEECLTRERDNFPENSPRHVLLESRAASMEMIKLSIVNEEDILGNNKRLTAHVHEKERLRYKLIEALDDAVESPPLPGEIVNLSRKVPIKTFGPFPASLPMRKAFAFQIGTGKKMALGPTSDTHLRSLYDAWISGSHAALCGMITDLYPGQTAFIDLHASVAIEVRLDGSVSLLLFDTS